MRNTFKIVWSKRAYNNLEGVIAYLEKNWTDKEINKFAKVLEQSLSVIEKTRKLFRLPLSGLHYEKQLLQNTILFFTKLREILLN
jgi:plasmid stabilization system protein ParE